MVLSGSYASRSFSRSWRNLHGMFDPIRGRSYTAATNAQLQQPPGIGGSRSSQSPAGKTSPQAAVSEVRLFRRHSSPSTFRAVPGRARQPESHQSDVVGRSARVLRRGSPGRYGLRRTLASEGLSRWPLARSVSATVPAGSREHRHRSAAYDRARRVLRSNRCGVGRRRTCVGAVCPPQGQADSGTAAASGGAGLPWLRTICLRTSRSRCAARLLVGAAPIESRRLPVDTQVVGRAVCRLRDRCRRISGAMAGLLGRTRRQSGHEGTGPCR